MNTCIPVRQGGVYSDYHHARVPGRRESVVVPGESKLQAPSVAARGGPPTDPRTRARGVVLRFGAGLLVLNVFAAVQVTFVVALLARSESASVSSVLTDPAFSAFRWLVPVGVTIGAVAGAALVLPTLRWVAEGATPTRAQAERASRLPLLHTASHLTLWLAFGFTLAVLTHDSDRSITVLIIVGTIFGAVTTAGTGYLLTERALRPVTVLAMSVLPATRRELSVLAKLVTTWIVCTAFPVAAITLIVVAHSTGTPVVIPAGIELPILIVSAIALATGLRGTVLVARSVSEPVKEVSSAMAQIESGDIDVNVPIYDSSEIGDLQRGFNRMSAGLTERERLRDLFGRHVGKQVASRALEQFDFPRGEVQYAAVLFIDLVGSTAFAVDHPPEQVAAVLNEFLAVVVETVDENLGFINKFEGDAALAIFGAPQPIDNPAAAALKSARELRAKLGALESMHTNASATAPGAMDYGIGVAAGAVFAGDIGATQRYEYTVIGEPVNCAARLSDLAKNEPSRILAERRVVDDAHGNNTNSSVTTTTTTSSSNTNSSGTGGSGTAHVEQDRWIAREPVQLRGLTSTTEVATIAQPY